MPFLNKVYLLFFVIFPSIIIADIIHNKIKNKAEKEKVDI